MSETTIDLSLYRTPGSKIFTGRDRGKQVKKNSDLDDKSKSFDKINIIIPVDIYSINPSFLEEFLHDAVVFLGKERFYEKFRFINEGDYKISQDLDEAIDRILRDKNALI